MKRVMGRENANRHYSELVYSSHGNLGRLGDHKKFEADQSARDIPKSVELAVGQGGCSFASGFTPRRTETRGRFEKRTGDLKQKGNFFEILKMGLCRKRRSNL